MPEISEALRFPIGRYGKPAELTPQLYSESVARIAALPAQVRQAAARLPEALLDTPYREGGWTIRQVIHHLADSHMNSYIRCKLALTEDNPAIKPYDENAWATLPDAKHSGIGASLAILEAVHERWVLALRSCDEAGRQRTFFHPESKKTFSIAEIIHFYAWHGEHHLAHIDLVHDPK